MVLGIPFFLTGRGGLWSERVCSELASSVGLPRFFESLYNLLIHFAYTARMRVLERLGAILIRLCEPELLLDS